MQRPGRTLGSNRRLTWPAKPPFPASILMSGTGPPVFTASGGPTPGASAPTPVKSCGSYWHKLHWPVALSRLKCLP